MQLIMQTSQENRTQTVGSPSVWCRLLQGRDVLQFLIASVRASLWRKLKNGIKFIIGRDSTFDETGLFLRQYLLHVTGIRPIRKITCTGLASEGAGSQALMIMNAIIFSRSYGFEYVHTPFHFIQHAEQPMAEWVAAWESLFNLGVGESPCNGERRDAVDFCYNFTGLGQCFGSRWRSDELTDGFRAMIPELRRKYHVNKCPGTTGKSNQLTVAVHIRRGDVCADDLDYFTSNDAILRTITTVQSVLNARNIQYKIVVHSQGSTADFADLSQLGVELSLNVDAVWTIQELIKSDILIMAKGCFSYCAGLISCGIKIFEPDPLPDDTDLPSWKWRALAPEENWIACKADGSFDPRVLEHQLVLFTQAQGALL
jgi:hypothetical protein